MKKLIKILLFSYIFLACNPISNPGKELYKEKCQNCHGIDGKGLKGLYPPITQSDYYINNRSTLACIIQNGMQGDVEVNGKIYNEKMPSNPLLTEAEITNLLNFMNSEFFTDSKSFTLKEVSNNLRNCD